MTAGEASTESSELCELRWQVGHYRSLHARVLERERALKQEVHDLEEQARERDKALQQQLRDHREGLREREERIAALLEENERLRARQAWLESQVFGRKSEAGKPAGVEEAGLAASAGCAALAPGAKKRGKQPGAKGYGRKCRPELPSEEIAHDLPEDKRRCPRCGEPLRPFPWTEDSEEIHWEVRLIRRIHKRTRYLPTCDCGVLPGIVAAPMPPKLIPKAMFSTEFWTRLLMEKFLFQRPVYRVRQALALEGLSVSQGTLTGGLQRLGPLLLPLHAGILERNRAAEHWHMDETRWLVFQDVEGKAGHRWWLWVCVTADTCVFILDPSRSAEVPKNHLGADAEGILNADRYSAYKTLEKVRIAFCWSHVRRDFLRVRDGYPALRRWGEAWVERIDELFELNAKRLELRGLPGAFKTQQRALEVALAAMVRTRSAELGQVDLHPIQRKALASLLKHWKGLTLFVDRSDIPMDNNESERRLRNPIVGRKNYYGSGSIWSGHLSARLFTLFQTLLMNHIDPRQFLLAYFAACAQAGGRPPADVTRWLPWNLAEEHKAAWRYPKQPP